jgi:UDP-glucose 4-epimerase
VEGFVLASTNAVVGHHEGTMTEAAVLGPLTPYGATKAAAEMLVSGYAGAYGLRTPRLRLGNVYGPGMVEKDSLVPRLMRAAAQDEGIEIYGDGLQCRDLVHVADVARAFVMAADGWPSGPVIVGSGISVTVLDVVEAAREATGCAIPASHLDAKPGEMRAVVLDTSLARSRGWLPTESLVEGLRDAWADFAPMAR